MKQMNAALETFGGKITSVVGTMWCAIAFAIIALVSLPGAIATGNLVTIISWIAQTFLQLVLLSVIMVGQDLQARGTALIIDRKSTRLNSSHANISYAVFCLKKK